MFKIIYKKETGEIEQITSINNLNELTEDQRLSDYIVVEALPETKPFYQGLVVSDNKLEVINYDLTEEQKATYRAIELQQEINQLKEYLDTQWSWKYERLSAELLEVKFGLRTNTTDTQESLILIRKDKVNQINQLQEELKIVNSIMFNLG